MADWGLFLKSEYQFGFYRANRSHKCNDLLPSITNNDAEYRKNNFGLKSVNGAV